MIDLSKILIVIILAQIFVLLNMKIFRKIKTKVKDDNSNLMCIAIFFLSLAFQPILLIIIAGIIFDL